MPPPLAIWPRSRPAASTAHQQQNPTLPLFTTLSQTAPSLSIDSPLSRRERPLIGRRCRLPSKPVPLTSLWLLSLAGASSFTFIEERGGAGGDDEVEDDERGHAGTRSTGLSSPFFCRLAFGWALPAFGRGVTHRLGAAGAQPAGLVDGPHAPKAAATGAASGMEDWVSVDRSIGWRGGGGVDHCQRGPRSSLGLVKPWLSSITIGCGRHAARARPCAALDPDPVGRKLRIRP